MKHLLTAALVLAAPVWAQTPGVIPPPTNSPPPPNPSASAARGIPTPRIEFCDARDTTWRNLDFRPGCQHPEIGVSITFYEGEPYAVSSVRSHDGNDDARPEAPVRRRPRPQSSQTIAIAAQL